MGVMPSAVFSVSFLLSTGGCCATELKTYMARTDGWVIDSANARSCTAICSEVGKTCTAASETIMTNAAASASALKTALGSQFSTFCPGGVQDTNPSDDVPFLFAPGNFCEYGRGSYRSRCETAGENWKVRRICYCQATPAPSPAPTPAPSASPTPAPSASPTPAPTPATPSPTPAPTQAPTPAPTPARTPAAIAAAVGDPHLVNIHGERFDLLKDGSHLLVEVPQFAAESATLLAVAAVAQPLWRRMLGRLLCIH
ncbi:unnamed protein product [Prorocentrum cordatum]|uniref:Uncharacterized protein n=1 Tax=Prorocentrum cordatum TaxID=2364126 RepID=A0ABN9UFN5_9DINO|nr:unnamed protein product [Polarella glacialis]